jgi:hypothetical protein
VACGVGAITSGQSKTMLCFSGKRDTGFKSHDHAKYQFLFEINLLASPFPAQALVGFIKFPLRGCESGDGMGKLCTIDVTKYEGESTMLEQSRL